MVVRSATALAVLGALAASLAASPALAQTVTDPSGVLAGRSHAGFTGRTARLSSIMGPELSVASPLKVPTRPVHPRPFRRDATALAH